MIVADTSALIAIIMRETGYDRVVATIHGQRVILPASCYLEAAQVLAGRRQGRAFLDRLLEEQDAEFVSIDEPTIRIAADAFERYGKGRGHPAQLNFGDCMSYAVAKRLDAALLFVGRDLIHTDLRRAVPV